MKPWMFSLAVMVIVTAASCKSQPAFQDPFLRPQIDWTPGLLLDIGQADRILGNHSRLAGTTAYVDEGTKAYQSSFRDDWRDPETGKTGILYYMYEEYQRPDTARSYLDSTLKANHVSLGDGIHLASGADIYYLSGGPIIRMVMILKGNLLVRVKVNQVTSRYSLDEFQKVAGDLAGRL